MEHENTKGRQCQYEILSLDEVYQHMNSIIEEVRSIVELPERKVCVLLAHFKWNKETLIDQLYGNDRDPNTVYLEVCLSIDSFSKRQQCKIKTSKHQCRICLANIFQQTAVCTFDCGHTFCKKCIHLYLSSTMEEASYYLSTITCPVSGCQVPIDDQYITENLKSEELTLKYKKLVFQNRTSSFIKLNECLRFCPFPDCKNVIKVESPNTRETTCKCGYTFCFSCGRESHVPATCQMLTDWSQDQQELEFGQTRSRRAYKNDLLNCSKSRKKSCVPLAPAITKSLQTLYLEARLPFEVMKMCNNEFQKYELLLKFANKDWQLKTIQPYIEQNIHQKLSSLHVTNLKKGADLLDICRITLKYSFIVLYNIKRDNYALLFVNLLEILKTAIDDLSRWLKPKSLEALDELPDKLTYCCNCRKAVIEHISERNGHNGWSVSSESSDYDSDD